MRMTNDIETGRMLQPRNGQLLDRLYDEPIQHLKHPSNSLPQVDILEDESKYELHLSVPGFKREDLQVELNRNQLIISGHRNEIKMDDRVKLHRKESFQGKFKRVFNIPDNAEPTQTQARYQNGILTVVIPKQADAHVRTTIPVE